jgi:hypothetical protein
MKIKSLVSVVLTAAVVALAPAVSAGASTGDEPFPTTNVGGVEVTTSTPITDQAALDEFVLSSTPKVITVDTATGSLETVEEVEATEVATRGISNPCAAGAA